MSSRKPPADLSRNRPGSGAGGSVERGAGASAGRPSSPGRDTAQALLDAALEVVTASGLRGLTYRSVETAAGMPHGSVAYHFKSWDGLVQALLAHIERRSEAIIAPLSQQLTLMISDRSRPLDIATVAQQLVIAFDAEREVQLARYELQTGGARERALGECLSALSARLEAMTLPIVTACGSDQPERDALLLVTAIDGWVFSRLTIGRPDSQTLASGIELLLRAFTRERGTGDQLKQQT